MKAQICEGEPVYVTFVQTLNAKLKGDDLDYAGFSRMAMSILPRVLSCSTQAVHLLTT